ncbi:putative spermidine/putrescine transport system ATP-binding protein/molybdate/tungstate transport system ATP-binding protein [Halobiforma haloterrestris]|uniref:Molybdate/tungstate import ATP-binding protein WtpC n=1 Tax=Natronobacterium haloterrestre TaxID=148448 RepID=A0A1I1D407_NATHA|nr:ABC transporter ATP-binding protein [Halobiforma haloterrestris]SFB67333.1 putative spermidine/putrescine transport system ATP-binding protein/molybdate/tungstate transport system ATP-binding protein [Halobiforma haloterrestris]
MTLELEGVSHRYGDELAVSDVSFGAEPGELVGLLGPSGCGKTTLVQAIAGHVRPTAGRILLRGDDVTDTPPERRHVSVVFQRPTLYPHMTVSENVAYGLAARGMDREERDARTRDYLDLVDLEEQCDSYPTELSGGQQRRVELARALAPQPDVLLLDEPLSGLDPTLRERLRDEIARIQRETGVTTLFVTHDQEDAMALADRLVVMNDGRVAGSGHPRRLYDSPPTPFVASFLGRSNTLSGTVVNQDPLTVAFGDAELSLDGTNLRRSEGETVLCHVRPKDLSFAPAETNGASVSVTGEVKRIVDLGRRYDVTLETRTGDEVVVEEPARPPSRDESVSVSVPGDCVTVFDGEQSDSSRLS